MCCVEPLLHCCTTAPCGTLPHWSNSVDKHHGNYNPLLLPDLHTVDLDGGPDLIVEGIKTLKKLRMDLWLHKFLKGLTYIAFLFFAVVVAVGFCFLVDFFLGGGE